MTPSAQPLSPPPATGTPGSGTPASAAPAEATAPHVPAMTLDHLAVGGRARVTAVGGDTAIRRRLLEMGLTPGIAVALIRRAPLGDPLELLVRDYQLSLRRDQARLVTIVPA